MVSLDVSFTSDCVLERSVRRYFTRLHGAKVAKKEAFAKSTYDLAEGCAWKVFLSFDERSAFLLTQQVWYGGSAVKRARRNGKCRMTLQDMIKACIGEAPTSPFHTPEQPPQHGEIAQRNVTIPFGAMTFWHCSFCPSLLHSDSSQARLFIFSCANSRWLFSHGWIYKERGCRQCAVLTCVCIWSNPINYRHETGKLLHFLLDASKVPFVQ